MFVLTATTPAVPPTPPPDDSVVAGPIGFAVFILLILATAFLCWSFTRQLRKAQKAKEAGLYGDDPVDEAADADTPETHDAEA